MSGFWNNLGLSWVREKRTFIGRMCLFISRFFKNENGGTFIYDKRQNFQGKLISNFWNF